MINNIYVDNLIKTALLEDINYVDIATDYLIPDADISTATLIAKADGVLAGLDIAIKVFDLLDGTVTAEKFLGDGDTVQKGDVIAKLKGNTKTLLKGERTALNLLQHTSGIATETRKCVDSIKGTTAVIADTRKTLAGLRPLQKYAVTVGGGRNHRYNLSDAAMLKDNHIDAYGSITGAVTELRKKIGHMAKIEVEVRNFEELNEALAAKVDVIMLDNMSTDDMKKAVDLSGDKAVLEASGNITADNISEVAKTGVGVISLGALTHSVKAFDISMKIDKDQI